MRKCLITVDYQADFVNGSLGFDGAEKLENVIAEKNRKIQGRGCRHYIHSRYPSLRLLNYF